MLERLSMTALVVARNTGYAIEVFGEAAALGEEITGKAKKFCAENKVQFQVRKSVLLILCSKVVLLKISLQLFLPLWHFAEMLCKF